MLQENKLDDEIEQILVLKQNIGRNFFDLGRKLSAIKTSKIYLEKYGNWMAFLNEGIDISEGSAERFIRVSNSFSPNEFATWGVKKLSFLLSLEEPRRRDLMLMHNAEDSFTEIKKSAIKLNVDSRKQEEFDYFLDLEDKLKALTQHLGEAKVFMNSLKYKSNWNDYPRKEKILKMWDELKNGF